MKTISGQEKRESKFLSPVKAIRAKCIWCCSGQLKEIRLCTVTDCPLYPYRMGKAPNRKKKLSARENTEIEQEAPPFINPEAAHGKNASQHAENLQGIDY